MAVMVREAWTDERLDDLAARMDKGFDRVDADIRELRTEMNDGFRRMDGKFDRVDERFESMQRTMIIGLVTLFASIVASVIGGVFAASSLS